jgi:electron transfer flavoprotein beta subunit
MVVRLRGYDGEISAREAPVRIVIPVKWVPDTAAAKHIDPQRLTVDRTSVASVLCPVNEFAIEEAVRIKEARGDSVETVVLIVGPEAAGPTAAKALSYGLDRAVRVTDDAIAGSDALGTAQVLAAAIRTIGFDIVMFGNQSTDARTSLVPAAVAEILGVPSITYARRLEVGDGTLTADREHEEGWDTVTAPLPAVVSVVEAINEPRFPSFKGIMAAKSKPSDVWGLSDLAGLDVALVGAGAARAVVATAVARPPKAAGTVVTDDGSGAAATQLLEWMAEKKFV